MCPGGGTSTRTCRSKSSEIKVRWICNGYSSCHLRASSQIFGNPCANFSKYLEIKYYCVSSFIKTMKGILSYSIIYVMSKSKLKNHSLLGKDLTMQNIYDSIILIKMSALLIFLRYFFYLKKKVFSVWKKMFDLFQFQILI